VKAGGADVELKLDGPSRHTAKVRDNDDGTYTVTYRITGAGKYNAVLSVGGKSAPHFAFIVAPGEVSSGKSIAIGPGISKSKAGEDAKFLVQSLDNFGNEIQTGGAYVQAFLKKDGEVDEELIEAVVVDKQNGIYDATYQVETSGRYTLVVTLNAEQIAQSPFTVRAVSGPVFAKKTLVKPIVDNPSKAKAGVAAYKFHLRDRIGNPRTKGGDELNVFLRRPIRRPATVVDNGDGSYDVIYPPGLERGEYELAAEVKGETVELPNISIHVDEPEPLPQEEQEIVEASLPSSSSFIVDILRGLDESKKKAFLADLQSLRK